MHDDLPVDQPLWLRPDDIAQGKETVVDAASAEHPISKLAMTVDGRREGSLERGDLLGALE